MRERQIFAASLRIVFVCAGLLASAALQGQEPPRVTCTPTVAPTDGANIIEHGFDYSIDCTGEGTATIISAGVQVSAGPNASGQPASGSCLNPIASNSLHCEGHINLQDIHHCYPGGAYSWSGTWSASFNWTWEGHPQDPSLAAGTIPTHTFSVPDISKKMTAKIYTNTSNEKRLKVLYTSNRIFPNYDEPIQPAILWGWLPTKTLPAQYFTSIQDHNGTGTIDIPISDDPGRKLLKVYFYFCGGSESRVLALPGADNDCDSCSGSAPGACVGHPVRVANGNMRYPEVLPLPSSEFADVLGLTYDSNNNDVGFFGRGWTSALDAWLRTSDSGNTVTLSTEGNSQVVFENQSGAYVQLWPAGSPTPGVLTDTGSTFEYRAGGGDLLRVFRKSDGVLVSLRRLASEASVDITYVNGVPQTVGDSQGRWQWVLTTNGTVTSISVAGRSDLHWLFQYDEISRLSVITAPDSNPWRTYEYANLKLSAVRDGANHVLESHDYDNATTATTSRGQSGADVTNIERDLPGRTEDETITRVTSASGQISSYYIRPIGGRPRTVQIDGGCSSCGTGDAVYGFDDNGNLLREQDARGYIKVSEYDASGTHLLSVTNAMRPVTCDPETDTNRCRLTPDTILTTPLQSTSATDKVTYRYDDTTWNDKPTKISHPGIVASASESWTDLVYDAATGLVLQSSVSGRVTATGPVETHTTTTSLYNGTESAAFNPNGMYASTITTAAQPVGRAKSIDGPRTDVADVTTTVYYPFHTSIPATWQGRLAAAKQPNGSITKYEEYDVWGNAARVIDANGVVTTTTYDALGRLLTTTVAAVPSCDTGADPLCSTNITSTRTYGPGGGPLATVVAAGGGTTKYHYDDDRGRNDGIFRGPWETDLRELTDWLYDPATGMKTDEAMTDIQGGYATKRFESYTFDPFGRRTETIHDDGAKSVTTYDALGNIASLQDENHSTPNAFYQYDAANRMIEMRQSLAGTGSGSITTSYSYDSHSNLATVTDPNGNVTSYGYDDFDRLTSQTSPVTGVTTYTYDPAGNLTSTTDANGATTTRTYDASNRVLTSTAVRSGTSESTTWPYDDVTSGSYGEGRLASITEPTGSTTYRYERRGLLAREQKTINGSAYTTTFTYDADGNRQSIHYPSGRIATWTYDYADRPYSVSVGSNAIITSTKYYPFGPQSEMVFGNGTTQTMSWDMRYLPERNKLAGTGPAPIADYSYSHDSNGNITAIHDEVDHNYDRNLLYDDLNRLVTANTGAALWGTGSYTYDAMGDIRSLSLGSRTSTFTYDGLTSRLNTVVENGVSRHVTYDAAGNEIRVGSVTFDYSPTGKLTTAGSLFYTSDGRGIRTTTSAPCPTTATPSPLHSGAVGATGSIAISASTDCAWTATAGATWITLSGTTSGTGPGTVTYTVAPNSGTTGRTSTITLSAEVSIPVTQPGSTVTTTSTDVTGDGVTDLLWRNEETGEVRAFGMDGLGVATTMSLPAHSDLLVKLVGIGDFDGDGRSDLFWRHGRSGDLTLDFVRAGGTVTSQTVSPETTTSSHLAGVGDLNGDHKADLVWRDETNGALSARLMNGATAIISGTIVASTPLESVVAGIGDLDGDGRSDLVSYDRRTGEVHGRLMSGLTILTEGTITTEPNTQWRVVALGDCDGDGKADLIWRNRTTGATGIQLMSTGLTAQTRVAVNVDTDTRWQLAGTGDADGDGKADLLWRNRATGAVRVDLVNGTQIASSATVYTEPDTAWSISTPASASSSQQAARFDFAADGTSDLIWRHSPAPADIALWEMKGPTVLDGGTVATLADTNQRIQTAGDFKGDGTSDLLWRNVATNWISIWEMKGRTIISGHTLALLNDPNWQVQAAGDVTADGVDDIILRNTFTNAVALWEIRGGLLLRGDIIATLTDPNWQVQGIGDFFGEGQASLLWRNTASGNVAIWQINSRTVIGSPFATVALSSSIQGVGDYNGDGRADILWRDTDGKINVWEMNGTTVMRTAFVGKLTDATWTIQATSGDYGGDHTWDILLRDSVNGTLAMWEMKGSAIRTNTSFASAGSDWTLEALERNGASGETINTMAVETAGSPKAWWTPLQGAAPFWGPAAGAQPQPPWIAGPPALPQLPFWIGPSSTPGVPWWTPLSGALPPPVTGTPPLPTLPPMVGHLTAETNEEPERRRVSAATSDRSAVVARSVVSTTRRYSLYTPELNLLAETESTTATTPAIQYEYVWFDGRPVAQIENASGTVHYYFDDHLGTPLLTTNASGAVDWQIEREPYGARFALRVGTAGHQPLALPGQEDDGITDRSYNIFRWYRDGWGRYTQADPIGLGSEAVTLYVYAADSPTNEIDPSGLISVSPGLQCPAFDRAVKRLQELRKNCNCKDFFHDQFAANFADLIDGPLPVVRPHALTDSTALAETPCAADPGVIWIKPNLCSRFRGGGLSGGRLFEVLVHELGHYADCAGQRYPPSGSTEEGVHAELRCLGHRIEGGNQLPGPIGPPFNGPWKP
jgi:RHS repeat-associated protein